MTFHRWYTIDRPNVICGQWITIQWGLLRIGSTSGSLMCISFHVFKNNDPKMVKCYRHKEWVLFSSFEKEKLNQTFKRWRLSPLFDKVLSFCNKRQVQLRKHRETIIVVIWCTYIQLQARKYS